MTLSYSIRNKTTYEGKMKNVKFKTGHFSFKGRDIDVTDKVLPLSQGFKIGVRGGYVTVNGSAVAGYPDRNIKVYVDSEQSYTEVDSSVPATGGEETDEQVIERLRDRFSMLTDMTKAVRKGDVRAMIVSGPPGVGKSHGVEEVLDRYKTLERMGGKKNHEVDQRCYECTRSIRQAVQECRRGQRCSV